MSSIGSPSPFFLAGKKAYQVKRSLRFNHSDSAYLQFQPSSDGNRQKWTWSGWVKRVRLGSTTYGLFTSQNGGDGGGNNGIASIYFGSDDKIHTYYDTTSGDNYGAINDAVYRDISAWYHIVWQVDAANSTSKIFVNGVQQTIASGSQPVGGYSYTMNQAGKRMTYGIDAWDLSTPASIYVAECHYSDGQLYDADVFAETNSVTGQWVPKSSPAITYGTNGHYLNFSDNSAATATKLGKDLSGNGNNFTPNNFTVSDGAGNDSLEDTPTNNFCTLNPIQFGQSNTSTVSFSNGNLDFSDSSTNNKTAVSTFGLKSGKYYFELLSTNTGTYSIGMTDLENNNGSFYRNNGSYSSSFGGGGTSGYASWTTNDVIGVAVDFDSGKIWYAKNNTWQSGDPSTGNSPTNTFTTGLTLHSEIYTDNSSGTKSGSFNFGQRAFTYTPPTGFKALNSANLPDPTIKLPNKHFDTLLWSGNSSTQAITGLNFSPDWVWSKRRSATSSHYLSDTIRGVHKILFSELTGAEYDGTSNNDGVDSFDSNGFTFNNGTYVADYNASGSTYVGWNWNAGDTDGKTYTVKVVPDNGNKYRFDNFGTSAVTLDLAEGGTYIFNMDDASNASHPFMIGTTANDNTTAFGSGIVYKLDGVVKTFAQYHAGFAAATTRRLEFTIPASTNNLFYFCYFHSGMGGQVNTNSTLGSSNFDGTLQSIVKANTTAGFSIVTYTGNGSSGSTIGHGLGVTPNFCFMKRRDSTQNWLAATFDLQTARELNTSNPFLEGDYDAFFTSQPTSTTITMGNDDVNNKNGSTYVGYIFSEVAGYSKFGKYTGNGSSDGTFVFTGFRPALVILKSISNSESWQIKDNKRVGFNDQNHTLFANNSNTEYTTAQMDLLSNGFKLRNSGGGSNGSGENLIYLAFAESPFKNARAR